VFDDFGKSAQALLFRQRGEEFQIADHKFGLIEHPDHVLVPLKIDTVFAPHAGIDL